MKDEKINWGLLFAIIAFWCCLELGTDLDVQNEISPATLHSFKEGAATAFSTPNCGTVLLKLDRNGR